MMKIAMVELATETPLKFWFLREGEREVRTHFPFEDGSRVSPVCLGWSSKEHAVMEVRQFVEPEGKVRVGDASYAVKDGVLVEGYAVEDAPPPPDPVPADYPLKRWQFKAMVEVLGVGAAIEGAIDTVFADDALARAKALARYRESDVYERGDPLFDLLAPAVGLTGGQIDEAWMQIVGGD